MNRRVNVVVWIAVCCLLAGAAWFRQPVWPPLLFIDEGFVLDGAINLALYGQYAMRSAEGFRVLDQPLVANGPGIVLPLALTFDLFGVGIEQARLVAGLFMAIAGLAFFWIARRLTGTLAALISLVLLIALPREGFMYLGRMAIGTIPGLAYFLVGGVIWVVALRRQSLKWAVAAGLFFGIAAVTKGQYSLVIFPALALAWIVNEFWLKRTPRQLFAAALLAVAAMLVAWYAARFIIVGPDEFAQHLANVQSATRSTVLTFDPMRYAGPAIIYFVRSGAGPIWLLGMAFAIWHIARRTPQADGFVLFASTAAAWMGWYLLLSNGWARYAFDTYALACLTAGGALVWLGRGVWQGMAMKQPNTDFAGFKWTWPARALAAGIVIGVGAFSSYQMMRRAQDVLSPADTSAAEFVTYLDKTVAPDARVATWEWQLTILTRRVFERPETAWVDRYTEVIFAGVPLTQTYGLAVNDIDYVVNGPFSKWTGLYTADLNASCCELVGSVGPYDLHRVHRVGWQRQHQARSGELEAGSVENASKRDY